MLKISYIKLLKTLYLKAPNESHSCILLFNVLYNIAQTTKLSLTQFTYFYNSRPLLQCNLNVELLLPVKEN